MHQENSKTIHLKKEIKRQKKTKWWISDSQVAIWLAAAPKEVAIPTSSTWVQVRRNTRNVPKGDWRYQFYETDEENDKKKRKTKKKQKKKKLKKQKKENKKKRK